MITAVKSADSRTAGDTVGAGSGATVAIIAKTATPIDTLMGWRCIEMC
jgi:hypothetical protein